MSCCCGCSLTEGSLPVAPSDARAVNRLPNKQPIHHHPAQKSITRPNYAPLVINSLQLAHHLIT